MKEGHKAELRSFKWIHVYTSKCTSMCAPRRGPLLLMCFLETFKIQENNRTSVSELQINLLFLCCRFNEDFLIYLLLCWIVTDTDCIRIFKKLTRMFSYGDISKEEVLTLKILLLTYINKISCMTLFIASNECGFPRDLNSYSALPVGAVSFWASCFSVQQFFPL